MNQKNVWHSVRALKRLGATFLFVFSLLLFTVVSDVSANAGNGAFTGATGNPAAASGPSESGALNVNINMYRQNGQRLSNNAMLAAELDGEEFNVEVWFTNTKGTTLTNPQISMTPNGLDFQGVTSGGTGTGSANSAIVLNPGNIGPLGSRRMVFKSRLTSIQSNPTRNCFSNISATVGGANQLVTAEDFCIIPVDSDVVGQTAYRVINVCGSGKNDGVFGNEECDDGDLDSDGNNDSCDQICRTTQPYVFLRKEAIKPTLSGASIGRGEVVHLVLHVHNQLARHVDDLRIGDDLGDIFEVDRIGGVVIHSPSHFGGESVREQRPIADSEYSVNGSVLSFDVGRLEAGEKRRYHYFLKVKSNAPFITEDGRTFEDDAKRYASVVGGSITHGGETFLITTQNGTPRANPTIHYIVEDATPVVGNGRLEAREECEDGDAVPGNGCDEAGLREVSGDDSPIIQLCNNDVLDQGEACIGDNRIEGDGCNQYCAREVFYCGNGVVERSVIDYAGRTKDQICPDGTNLVNEFDVNMDGQITELDHQLIINHLNRNYNSGNNNLLVSSDDEYCYNVARQSDGSTEYVTPLDALRVLTALSRKENGVPNYAGDLYNCPPGAVCNSEQCDDGNFDDNDGCSSTCQVEARIEVRLQGSVPRSGGVMHRGGEIWYSVFLTNSLSVPIDDISIFDPIENGITFRRLRSRTIVPAGASWDQGETINTIGALDDFVSVEGSGRVFQVGRMEPGERRQYKYVVDVNEDSNTGRLANMVYIRGRVGNDNNLEIANPVNPAQPRLTNAVITYIINDDSGVGFNNDRLEGVPTDPSRCSENNTTGVCLVGEQCDGAPGCIEGGSNISDLPDRNSCGNHRIDPGEVCDDGNYIDGDGCNAYCQPENFICGNGIQEQIPLPTGPYIGGRDEVCVNGHNPYYPYDVNLDGKFTALDLLNISNHINQIYTNSVPDSSPYCFNVSNDDRYSPLDVLQVINYINVNFSGLPSGNGSTMNDIRDNFEDIHDNHDGNGGFDSEVVIRQSPLVASSGQTCPAGLDCVQEQCDDGNRVEGDGCNNSCTEEVASLGIDIDSIYASGATLPQGITIPYTYVLHNTGDQVVTNIVVKDAIPSFEGALVGTMGEIDAGSDGITFTYDPVNNTITFEGYRLESGDSANFGFNVIVDPAFLGTVRQVGIVDATFGTAEVPTTVSTHPIGIVHYIVDDVINVDECNLNGRLEGKEQCDDNNEVNGDGCSDQCVLEDTGNCGIDGDGDGNLIDPGEQCDDGLKACSDGRSCANDDECGRVSGACTGTGATRLTGEAIAAYLDTLDLDVDGDTEQLPLSDGILIMRYIDGWRGNELTNGILHAGSVRDTAGVEEFLANNIESYDADGNSATQRNDGLVITRYLALFTGQQLLIDGACVDFGGGCEARSGDGCNEFCQNEVGICGNGIHEPAAGEQCDDGNLEDKDECSATCQTQTRANTCGDYIVDEFLGETCDDGKHCEDGTVCTEDATCAGVGDEQCIPRSGDGCYGLDMGADLICVHQENFDFDVVKTARPVSGASVRPGDGGQGDLIEYKITVRNTQYRDARELRLLETLNEKVTYVSHSGAGSNPTVLNNGRLVRVELPDLPGKVWVEDPTALNGGSFQVSEHVVKIIVSTNDGVDGEILSPGTNIEGRPEGSTYSNLGVSNPVFHYANDGISDPVCGNGILEGDETCDDNNTDDGDGCSSTCQLTPDTCGFDGDGDGDLIDPGETCDDGNRIPGDGCNEVCQREWLVCGNGVTENTNCTGIENCEVRTCIPAFPGDPTCDGILETCDDGNRDDFGPDGYKDGCDSNCQIQPAVCGDGVWEPGLGEECEDGNTIDGDQCSSDCKHEDPGVGDGAISVELQAVPASGSTVERGAQIIYTYIIRNQQYRVLEDVVLTDIFDNRLNDTGTGTQTLNAQNAFTFTIPELGRKLNAGEDPDPNAPASEVTITVIVNVDDNASLHAPLVQGSNALVTGEVPGDPNATVRGTTSTTIHFIDFGAPECGNGRLETGETCDDGNTNNNDGCSSTCQIEEPSCGVDGDGDGNLIDPGEECDDGNRISGDGCNRFCQLEHRCGNGHIGPNTVAKPDGTFVSPEQCDLGLDNGPGSGCTEFCELEEGRVRLTKYSNPLSGSVVTHGDEIEYTVEIQNLDALAYEALPGQPMIVDQLDTNLEYVTGSGTNGITYDSALNRLVVNIPSLPSSNVDAAGSQKTFTFRARVVSDANYRVTPNQASSNGQFTGDTDPTVRFSHLIKHYVVQPVDEDPLNEFVCGNGRLEVGEQCDDGDLDGVPIVGGVVISGCDENCQFVNVDTVCGNEVIDPGETCDDGNRISGDDCNRFCQSEVNICGNKFVDVGANPPEECDDGNVLSGDGCNSACRNETASASVELIPMPHSGNNIDDTDTIKYTLRVINTGDSTLDIYLGDILSSTALGTSTSRITIDSITKVPLGTPGTGPVTNLANGSITISGLVAGYDNRKEYMIIASVNDGAALGEMITQYRVITATTTMGGFNADITDNSTRHFIVEDATEVCGNGTREGDETCDDRNTISGDGCSGTESSDPADHCQTEANPDDCGNGSLDFGETCDDGNSLPGDGCNSLCQMEVFICGNGVEESTANGTECPALSGSRCVNEQCDDANRVDGDGCNASCQYEISNVTLRKEAVPVSGAVVQSGITGENGEIIREAGEVAYTLEIFNPMYFPINTFAIKDELLSFFDIQNATLVDETGNQIAGEIDQTPGNEAFVFPETETVLEGRATKTYTLTGRFLRDLLGTQRNKAKFTASSLDPNRNYNGNSNDTVHHLVDDDDFRCGNGRVENLEQCDDGDNDNGDGCSATCQLENPELCGNDTIDPGETCDDGPDQIPPVSGDGCSQFCQVETGFCGNGIKDAATEECDDGNLRDGDGCSAICESEAATATLLLTANYSSGASVPKGQQIIYTLTLTNTGDQAINNINLDGSLATIGAELPNYLDLVSVNAPSGWSETSPGVVSTNTIPVGGSAVFTITTNTIQETGQGHTLDSVDYHVKFAGTTGNGQPIFITEGGSLLQKSNDVSHFIIEDQPVSCGNGRVDQPSEQCDHGTLNGTSGCSTTCQFEGVNCGDQVTQSDEGEQCDYDDPIYVEAGLAPVGGDGCSEYCQNEDDICGNGVKEGTEACDDGNRNSGDGCSQTCTSEIASLNVILKAEPVSGSVLNDQHGIKYIIDVTNDGDQLLKNITLTNLFDVQNPGSLVRYENVNITGGDVNNNGAHTAVLNELAPGDTRTVEVTIQVVDGAMLGLIEHNVSTTGQTMLQFGTTDLTNFGLANPVIHYLIEDGNYVCGNGRLEPRLPIGSGFEECDHGSAVNGSAGSNCDSNCNLVDPSLCGDGIIQDGETCDDGPSQIPPISGDGCNRFCQSEQGFCGNGIVEGQEQCDDSNNENGDGCSASCGFENLGLDIILEAVPLSGGVVGRTDDPTTAFKENQILYTITVSNPNIRDVTQAVVPSLLPRGLNYLPGSANPGSVNGGSGTNDRILLEFHSINIPAQGARTLTFIGEVNSSADFNDVEQLVLESTARGAIAGTNTEVQGTSNSVKHYLIDDLVIECGNGRLEGNETCDDGQQPPQSGDGCSATCQLENPDLCGNNVIDPGEECDDGNRVSGDTCNRFCQLEGDECGNGVLETANGETCDDGNLLDRVTDPASPDLGLLDGCDSNCRIQTATCGDSVIDRLLGEVCDKALPLLDTGSVCLLDNGEYIPGKCGTNGGQDMQCVDGPVGEGGCVVRPIVCGDGNQEGNEQCDDGNTMNDDGCSELCQIETGVCGDGTLGWNSVRSELEECDDGNTSNDDGCSDICKIETGIDDLRVVLTSSPLSGSTLEDNDIIQYTVEVFNQKVEDALNVVLTVPLHEGTTFLSGDAEVNYTSGVPPLSEHKVEIDVGTLSPGAPARYSFVAQINIDRPIASNEITVTANAVMHNRACGDDPTNTNCAAGVNSELNFTSNRVIHFAPKAIVEECGNGRLEQGEYCDDGNTNDNDGCNASCRLEGVINCPNLADPDCKLPTCGNGVIDPGETCDDGQFPDPNKPGISGDGCNRLCQNEGNPTDGYICGNGRQETGEQCDDGNLMNGDGCDIQCQNEGNLCGNGILESAVGETCDDGNQTSGDGCSATCTTEGGGGGGGSAPVHSVIGVCSQNLRGDKFCSGARPTDGQPGWNEYRECAKAGASAEKQCAYDWAVAQGYTTCGPDIDGSGSLDLEESLAVDKYTDYVVIDGNGDPDCSGINNCPTCCPGPGCDMCSAPDPFMGESSRLVGNDFPMANNSSITKTIVTPQGNSRRDHTIREDNEVTYRIDVGLGPIDNIGAYELVGGNIRVHDHTIPSDSGGIENRVGIKDWFDCKSFGEACWTMKPSGLHGVVFERSFSKADINAMTTNTMPNLILEYTMDSRLAFTKDVANLENVVFAFVEYEFYQPGDLQNTSIQTQATLIDSDEIRNTGATPPVSDVYTDYCDNPNPPREGIEFDATEGQSTTVNLHRPYIQAAGGDVVIRQEDSAAGAPVERITGDAAEVAGNGNQTTFGRLFTGGGNVDFSDTTGDAALVEDDKNFIQDDGFAPTMDEYYTAVQRNAHEVTISGPSLSMASINFGDIDEEIISIKGDGSGQEVIISASRINIPNGAKTIIIEDADLIVENDLFIDDHYVAFIVRGGDIQIRSAVREIEGVYITEPNSSGDGGNIIGDGVIDAQLRVSGAFVGNMSDLTTSRTWIGEYDTAGNFQPEPNIKLLYDIRLLEDTPPSLSRVMGSDWAQGK